MTQRINLSKPNDGVNAMRNVEAWLAKSLDPRLLALVKLRASQINGCAFCLHMHSEEALKIGERVERLILLDAWHESALFTERERAALAWTAREVRRHFSEAEPTALSIAIAMINAWNRLAIGARAQHPADVRKAA
jgi:AhpD family alkylhydroperoxidase